MLRGNDVVSVGFFVVLLLLRISRVRPLLQALYLFMQFAVSELIQSSMASAATGTVNSIVGFSCDVNRPKTKSAGSQLGGKGPTPILNRGTACVPSRSIASANPFCPPAVPSARKRSF